MVIVNKNLPPIENSSKTQRSGTLPTYLKADKILDHLVGKGKTLDFGAGLGLSQSELNYDTFEPYPKGSFKPTYTEVLAIDPSSYKRIALLNVLNVVPPDVRDNIVNSVGKILCVDGVAVVTTRGRDVLTAKGTLGQETMSIITTINTYQKGFTQVELTNYLSATLGPSYKVQPIKLGPAGCTVTKLKEGV